MYDGGEAKKQINPRQKASLLSLMTFFFTFDLLRKGFKRDIREDDIYQVLPKLEASRVGDRLEEEFLTEKKRKNKPSIYRLLWNCYGRYYLLLGLFQLGVKIVMITTLPKAQGKLISYFTASTTLTKKDAVFYGVILIVLNFMICAYNHNYRWLITELGIKIKTAFCSLIYRKSLKLAPSSLSKNGIGRIVTLLSKDVNSFENVIIFWNDMWISLIILVVASCLIYVNMGPAALAGVSFLLLVIPLQVYLGKLTSDLRIKAAKATDERLQISQECLSGIKIIKMYTWEKFFCDKILQARKEEVKRIKQYYFARTTFIEMGTFVVNLTWYVIVITYIQLGNNLTAGVAFFLKECLNALRSPVTISIPLGILRSAEMNASVQRLNNFLRAEEQEEIFTCENPMQLPFIKMEKLAIKVENVVLLENINLTIDSGVNIVSGKVGSGKTALLKTIIQDFPINQGELKIEGSISYLSQDPWLFPSSIRQNILFGQKFNNLRYKEVLRVCALDSDIASFKNGDETILDDRGRNLSRGQQVRICLARAIYCERDIYVFDEFLSSLDVNIQEFVFTECIKKFLKQKIIIMVSNNQRLFEKADNVFVVENRTVKIWNSDMKGTLQRYFEEKEQMPEKIDEFLRFVPKKTYQNIYHEDLKKGKVEFNVYKKYYTFGGSILMLVWILLLYVATQTGLGYFQKNVSKWINIQQSISEISGNTTNSTKYQKLLGDSAETLTIYTVAIVSSLIFLFLRTCAYFNFAIKAATGLHKAMVLTVVNATMKFFDMRYFGNILNRFSKDMYNIDELLPFNIHECVKVLCQIASMIILIISVNIYFSIPSAIFFVILFLIRWFYLPSGRSLQRLDSATRSPVIGHLNATLEGLSTIKTSGTQNLLIKEFDYHQNLYISASYMDQSAERAFAFVLDMLSQLFATVIIIRFLVAEKDTQAGFVGLAIQQALSLRGILQWGIKEWANLENHMTSSERVLEFINAEKEHKTGDILKSLSSSGKITYDNVGLIYANSKEYVLKNINFTINSGEKIGIVGRTGAGKSSMISILFRLYEYEGTILINDVDIKTISLEYLRSSIVVIPQDPVVFNGTVRSNIDPTGRYDDSEIWNCIKSTNIEDLIPNLDYRITDNGSSFSCGEKQLLCLVRALVSKSRIIILDEATTNLDLEIENRIQEIIKNHFDKCTVLTIAHKLTTIRNSDRVMVLDHGQVVEFDNPDVLAADEESVFHKMLQRADLLQ